MKCKYDPAADAYLLDDGTPCKVDAYGDPTFHCQTRRTCSQHIARGERCCPHCIGRTRQDIKQITLLATLMLPLAIDDGLRSEALIYAGPAADPRAVADIRLYVHRHALRLYHEQKITEELHYKILAALPDEDDQHPTSLLTRQQMLLSEDYGHPLPPRLTLTGAASYLTRNLHHIAQDPNQDFPHLARQLHLTRTRLETVMHNSTAPDKGAPCPTCLDRDHLARLVRDYAHWCTNPDCAEQYHYLDDSGDVWRCPRNPEHWWTQQGYADYLEARLTG